MHHSTTEQFARMPPATVNAILEAALSGLEKLDPWAARNYRDVFAKYIVQESGGRRTSESGTTVVAPSEDGEGKKRKRDEKEKDKEKGGAGEKGAGGEDPQECMGCKAKSSPEWRRGPMGPRTLCNACGLVYIKIVSPCRLLFL